MRRTLSWQNVLRFAGPVVLAIGVIVFVVARWTGDGATEKSLPQGSGAPNPVAATGDPALLTQDVRDVAYKFIFSVVTGENPGGAWALLDSTFPGRSEFSSKKQWVAESKTVGLPVVPVSAPLRGPQDVRLSMGPSTATELTVEVTLIPKQGRPEEFELGLRGRGSGADKHWLVDYWNTRYRPGFLPEPK